MKYISLLFVMLYFHSASAQQSGTWVPEAAARASWDAHLLMEESRYTEAAPLFKKAIAAWNGRATADTWHEAARAFAHTGDTASANDALAQLCKMKRFFEHESILADSAFTALRSNARFVAAVKRIKTKHLDLAKQAALRNAIHPAQFATLQDKLSIFQNGYQVYGTQVYSENGKAIVFPIEDEAHVNQRRKALGMEPIATYLSHFGIQYHYDPNQPKTVKEIPRISHK